MNDRLYSHTCIVFAIEHYNPLGVIRSLGEAGIRPVYIAIKGRVPVASASKYISSCYHVDTVEEGYEILLTKYGDLINPNKPIIFCSDDKTIGFLDDHYDEWKDKFICYNAGGAGRINEYMDKFNILKLGKKHGLNVLDSRVLKKGNIPSDLQYPIITKSISPNSGGWKSDVFICNCKDDLKKAYNLIKSNEILVQRYIEKKNEFTIEGFTCDKGKKFFPAIGTKYKYLIKGYYSPYQDVFEVEDSDLIDRLSKMMEEIGFEGIFEIEFLVDKDNKLYFLEFNFRNATWSYASTKAGMPLPVLWAESMITGEIPHDARKNIPKNFTAMVEPIDYSKRVKTGKITLAQWLVDFKEANCGYYYSSDDPAPFELMIDNLDKLG